MTSAKLLAAPSEGHGLTDKILDPTYSALVAGQPAGTQVAVVVLKPVGVAQRETASGFHRHVSYEVVKCEPVLDGNQAAELRYLAQHLYESRTSTGDQRPLPLGIPGQDDHERCVALLERIEDWADDEGLTGADVEEKWRDHFGIGEGSESSYGDRGVPADYTKAQYAWLLEFGLDVGAIDRERPAADIPEDGEDAAALVLVDETGEDGEPEAESE